MNSTCSKIEKKVAIMWELFIKAIIWAFKELLVFTVLYDGIPGKLDFLFSLVYIVLSIIRFRDHR